MSTVGLQVLTDLHVKQSAKYSLRRSSASRVIKDALRREHFTWLLIILDISMIVYQSEIAKQDLGTQTYDLIK